MTERDDFEQRVTSVYAEQVAGLRQQLAAVDRNVMTYILDGRERGKQIDAVLDRLTACAVELQAIGRERWVIRVALLLLALGVGALLVKVF
jgi:hypothetical protein